MRYNDFHKTTAIKKTRKAHRCCWCGQAIDTSSAAVRHAGRTDGDVWSDYMHVECDMAADAVAKRYGEWDAGDNYARGRTDDDTTKPPEFIPANNNLSRGEPAAGET